MRWRMRNEWAYRVWRVVLKRTSNLLLCVTLSTLGATCQGTQAPPPGTTVKLVALDPISSATLKPGMIVRFRVWREVVVNGSTVIPAGTEVGAFVRSVSRGSKEHHRDGSVRLRLQPVDSGGYHITVSYTHLTLPTKA